MDAPRIGVPPGGQPLGWWGVGPFVEAPSGWAMDARPRAEYLNGGILDPTPLDSSHIHAQDHPPNGDGRDAPRADSTARCSRRRHRRHLVPARARHRRRADRLRLCRRPLDRPARRLGRATADRAPGGRIQPALLARRQVGSPSPAPYDGNAGRLRRPRRGRRADAADLRTPATTSSAASRPTAIGPVRVAARRSSRTAITQFFTVPASRAASRPRCRCRTASRRRYSPDGKYLAYTPLGERFRQWKNYRGGTASRIWILELDDLAVEPIPQPEGPLQRHVPDVGRRHRLLPAPTATASSTCSPTTARSKEVEQLTEHDDFPVEIGLGRRRARSSTSRPGYLHVFDPGSKQGDRLKIGVAADLVETRPRFVERGKYIRNADISPDGQARGLRVPRRDRHRPRQEGRRPQPHRRPPAPTSARPPGRPTASRSPTSPTPRASTRCTVEPAGRQGRAESVPARRAPASTSGRSGRPTARRSPSSTTRGRSTGSTSTPAG